MKNIPKCRIGRKFERDGMIMQNPTCEYCGCICIKDKKQKHCDICDACFIGYDHHCPWTSKCVAEGNKRVFYSFLMFCLIAFIYPVIVISSYNY